MSQLEANMDAIVLDGHAVIQALAAPSTPLQIIFQDTVKGFVSRIRSSTKAISTAMVSQVHIAFGRYLQDSIKSQIREMRNMGKSSRTYKV